MNKFPIMLRRSREREISSYAAAAATDEQVECPDCARNLAAGRELPCATCRRRVHVRYHKGGLIAAYTRSCWPGCPGYRRESTEIQRDLARHLPAAARPAALRSGGDTASDNRNQNNRPAGAGPLSSPYAPWRAFRELWPGGKL